MTGPPGARADVVVLTALRLEFDAVRAHLGRVEGHTDANGTRYQIGVPHGGSCRVALALIGEGNLAAAALTGAAVREFAPRAVIMVGVAGGLADDVAVGDVVVATRVHAYHGGREETGRFRPRPKGWPLAHSLEQTAREVARVGSWVRRAPPGAGAPAVRFKPIVSGEVVLDSRESPLAGLIAEHYGDAAAIDMESAGVAEGAHRNDFHRTVTVRGISDLADGGKRGSDAAGWQPRAAANAAAFAIALAQAVHQPPPAAPAAPPDCPYRGLAPFLEGDAERFFGRTEPADELVDLLDRHRVVAVVGRSGSGKSSLVHAGLIPRARARGWAVAALRPLPGAPAATAVAGALLPLLRPALDRVAASQHRAAVAMAVEGGRSDELVAEVGAPRLLVCVDRFEELIVRDEPAARDLAGLLLRLSSGAADARVVLTLPPEALVAAVERLGLGEAARRSVLLVPPMRSEQLRAAVEGPLAPTGRTFEPGLVERVVEAAEDEPGALALMQFALTRLWDEQRGGVLTHAAYDGFGGLGGAVDSYAEQVWTRELDDAERVVARRFLTGLVDPVGDDVVRRTARGADLDPDLASVARRLAATRLVVLGTDDEGGATYDLAHAALARHWRRMAGWLAQERDFRAWRGDLREGMRRGEPLRGPHLTQALRRVRERPDGVTAAERGFVAASRRGRRRELATRRGGVVAVVALLVLSGLFAVASHRRAGELEDQLRANAARLLAAQALQEAADRPDTAALLAVAAYRTGPEQPALTALAGEYLRHRMADRLLDGGVGPVRELALSPDGRVVAARGLAGTAVWWVDRAHRDDRRLSRIALSPDGLTLASSTDEGTIELLRPDGALTRLRQGPAAGGGATTLRFDPRGKRLLAVLPDAGLRLWDVERGVEVPAPPGAAERAGRDPGSAWFGPGSGLAVATGDRITLWDANTGAPTDLTLPGAPTRLAVMADGRTAIACTADALVYWDLPTRRERNRRAPPRDGCPTLAEDSVDHSGGLALGAPRPEGGAQHPRTLTTLSDLENGVATTLVTPATPAPVAPRVADTGGGARVITAVGSAVAVMDVPDSEFRPMDRAAGAGTTAVFSTKDPQLAVTTADHPHTSLRLWEVAGGMRISDTGKPEDATPLLFGADDRRLLTRGPTHADLAVLDVPSLRTVATPPLPAAPGARPAKDVPLGPFNGVCADHTASPDVVTVYFAGIAGKLDLRTGQPLDPHLRLWDDSLPLDRLTYTTACATRPGHDHLAVDTDRAIELWDLAGGHRRAAFATEDLGRVTGIRFTPDGRLLAALGQQGTLKLFDVATTRPVAGPLEVLTPGAAPAIVDFPTPDRIVVQNQVTTRIWDPTTPKMIADLDIPTGALPPSPTPDGGQLLLWNETGLTRVPTNPEEWATHLCRITARDLTDEERHSLPPGSTREKICP